MQPGGMPDLQQIFAQAAKMTEEMEKAEYTGTAGGGLVTAVVSGGGVLKSLTIDPKAVDPEDTETLADLVVAAVRDASQSASKRANDTLGGLGGALGLPGM